MLNTANTVFNEKILYPSYEIIGGEKIMAPSAPLYHSSFIIKLVVAFENYLIQNKKGYVFADNVDVHFTDGSIYKPDLVVITEENKNIMSNNKAIYGAPDLVVEVLSKFTKRNDLTIKKDTYEKYGVKEYWVVDPLMKIIDVYILRDGKYEFDDEYIQYDDDEFEDLTDAEKAKVKFEISPSIFTDLKIKLSDIFTWKF